MSTTGKMNNASGIIILTDNLFGLFFGSQQPSCTHFITEDP